MKKKLLMIWMIVVAAGLSGCGSANEPDAQAQGAAQETVTAGEQTESTGGTDETDEYADFYIEDPDVSLEELYAANDLRELAKNHESLSYTLESYDAQDHLESTVKGQFRFRDGRILFDSEMASLEESISYITCDELDGVTGAEYSYYPPDSDSSCYLTIYPADEYADIMAGRWMSNEKGLERKEELFDTSTQDGAILLQSRTTFTDIAEYYETLYYVQPETNLLLYKEDVWYTSEGEKLSVDRYSPVYDEPYEDENTAMKMVTEGDDLCHLTVVLEAGEQEEKVSEYDVRKGTMIFFESRKPYTVSSSGDMIVEISEISTNEDEVTIRATLEDEAPDEE